MWNASLKFAMVLLFAVNIQSLELAAEPRDPKSTVQELAELTTDMTRFAAIVRLSEDISFWQGVAIMAAQNDWEFKYSRGGKQSFEWTLRLYNSLDESLTEGIAASLAIARSGVLTDEDKRSWNDLYKQYETMRGLGEETYRLLKEGNVKAASDAYHAEVIQLRRDISGAAASSIIVIRNRVNQIALDVRLGK
jgi:hypothetical protein